MFIKVSLTDSILKTVLFSWSKLFSNYITYSSSDDSIYMQHFIFEVFDNFEETIELAVEWLDEIFRYVDIEIQQSENIHELIIEDNIDSYFFVKNDKMSYINTVINHLDSKEAQKSILKYFS